MHSTRFAAVTVAILVGFIAAIAIDDADSTSAPRAETATFEISSPTGIIDVGAHLSPVAMGTDAADLAWVVEEQERAEKRRHAEEEALERQRRASTPSASPASGARTPYHPGTTDGECVGFVIPDYIIQRESGGNASAYNPSGAYGCAQTMLGHYAERSPWNANVAGSCYGLDPFTIEGQRECVRILSNNGTNLSPWAATR